MSVKRMNQWITIFLLALFASQAAYADAPLHSKLGLNTDQAKVVSEIQAFHRKEMRSERQDLNREARKLRRARSANDSVGIATQEAIVRDLEEQMRNRILSEDAAIREVLTAEQANRFEKFIQERNDMVGSSRDARVLKR